MTISKEAPIVTMATIHHAREQDLNQVVDALRSVSKALSSDPLFLSATILSEPELMPEYPLTINNGLLRVAHYIQRRPGTPDPSRAALVTEVAHDAGAPTDALREYTVAFTSQRPGGDGSNAFHVGDVVAIGESIIFDPKDQARARDHMIENDGFIREHAEQLGWFSSNIHTSADGHRNINLIQFANRESAVLALTRAQYPPEQQAISRPDAHAYTVVDIQSAG